MKVPCWRESRRVLSGGKYYLILVSTSDIGSVLYGKGQVKGEVDVDMACSHSWIKWLLAPDARISLTKQRLFLF